MTTSYYIYTLGICNFGGDPSTNELFQYWKNKHLQGIMSMFPIDARFYSIHYDPFFENISNQPASYRCMVGKCANCYKLLWEHTVKSLVDTRIKQIDLLHLIFPKISNLYK